MEGRAIGVLVSRERVGEEREREGEEGVSEEGANWWRQHAAGGNQGWIWAVG